LLRREIGQEYLPDRRAMGPGLPAHASVDDDWMVAGDDVDVDDSITEEDPKVGGLARPIRQFSEGQASDLPQVHSF
jgi:hypothetical protein